ncbi:permease [Paenibacillus spongiae]|uniref:Permease n=1 Tax=Paenibacillus spongiae TaxID=2909671 RepID=A0ABY5SKF2_9BACL|nr:permease [Paenibacillus spongiae]UVI33177.1 permease [Paenibacillus spongiae]
MFAGHFGLAAAVKSKSPEVPLWALVVSTQLLDVFFVPLFLLKVETTEGSGYGGLIIHADYTHSLVGALLLAVLAGLLSGRIWGKRGGRIVAALVFSHWLLDLIVHRADMPILPGNIGSLPLLGFGVWEHSYVSIALEAALIGTGLFLYTRSLLRTSKNKGWAIGSGTVMGILLVLSLVADLWSV